MKRAVLLLFALLLSGVIVANAATITWLTPGETTNVSESTTVVASINDNVKPSTVASGTFYLEAGTTGAGTPPANCSGSNVAAALSVNYSSPNSVLTLTPASALESYTGYRACITTGVKNQNDKSVTSRTRSTTFTTRDYVPPSVTAVTPANASTVGTGSPSITFTFSEIMNTATINRSTFSITDGTNTVPISSFTISSLKNPNRTKVTVALSSSLTTMTTYYATIKGDVQDAAGNQMATDYQWFFSVDTTAPVTGSNYSPFPGPDGIAYTSARRPAIWVTFSEAADPGSISNSTFYLNPGVGGTVSYDSSGNTATFTPTADLATNTVYTVTVKGGAAGVKDLVGNRMATDFTWTFTEDYSAPAVSSASPSNNAVGVSVIAPITVAFSEATGMNASSINASTFMVSSSTGNEIGAITYDSTTKKAIFTVPGGLAFNTTYTVSLTDGIRDLAGNSLASAPYTWTFTTQAVTASNYSIVPPFITAPVTPNVLIILDNSNSMDEDMQGNAVGSPSCRDYSDPNTCSRSIMARKALIDIVNKYADTIRIGLMSYKLPSVSEYNLHNAFYFASYQPKSYCPNPPAACYNTCVYDDPNSGSDYESSCSSACKAQNSAFDVNYRDAILTTRGTATGSAPDNGTPVGSDKRKNYCVILYPKTQRYTDGSGEKIHYNLAGTLYSPDDRGTRYLYSSGYSSSEYPGQEDNYTIYQAKSGTADGNSGYADSDGSDRFYPTDDDFALGFYDFGKRMAWYHTGRTWYANSSPGKGYLHVEVKDNVSPGNSHLTDLLAKLRGDATPYAFQNDEAGYMGCSMSDANRCSYILNAGLTPTTGTLQSALDYFNGSLSTDNGGPGSAPKTPIQYSCQKNFIVYVTDGLPSVDESGAAENADALLSGVLDKLDALRCPTNSSSANCKVVKDAKKYDVKTYVLGVALSGDAQTSLDKMAVRGGTAQNGKAYYASNAAEFNNALVKIFESILANVSSGSAASIVNNRGQSGANLITAAFYPSRDFSGGSQKIAWIGDLKNYWYYFDPYLANSTIREDTNHDGILDLVSDYMVNIFFDDSTSTTKATRYRDDGKGNYTQVGEAVDLDSLNSLWSAGKALCERDLTASPSRKIYTTVDGSTFVRDDGSFTESDSTLTDALKPYLNVGNSDTQTAKIIRYIRGLDDPTDAALRNRTVDCNGVTAIPSKGIGVWKLGDIISSTPKIQSDRPINGYHLDYGDGTYKKFISSNNYSGDGMVYVGANDGMLHAFRLGRIGSLYTGTQKARLTNPGTSPPPLGSEEWAFIPRDALPYLKYYLDPDYSHMYYVDDTVLLVDASINKPAGCTETGYENCQKQTKLNGKSLDPAGTSWRTILIGGMGLGGASRPADGYCGTISGTLPDSLPNCVKSPVDSTGYTSLGLSSFFALDVTTPASPSLKWTFSDSRLGYSNVDPVIVRINGKDGRDLSSPDRNGKWFAVFASGPTGPIETTTHQFYGRSDQNLWIFAVDLDSGAVTAIDSGIADAFAGSLATNALDTDKWNKNSLSYSSTDVVYIGYVKPKVTGGITRWNDGGLLRLVTNNDTNPSRWKLSTVIDGTGPVTASIDKLYDDNDSISKKPELWLYFGSGRYFYKNTMAGIDSADDQFALYGVKEPCYSVAKAISGSWYKDGSKTLNTQCTEDSGTRSIRTIETDTLTNQTSDNPSENLLPGKRNGWFINLDASLPSGYKAERVVTTPSVKTNGLLQFTTFKPSSDVCGLGGETMFWLLNYATGAAPAWGTLKGKIIIQLSTGAVIVVDLSSLNDVLFGRGGRQIDIGPGRPPSPGPSSDSLKKPVKKILQIQER